MPAQVMSSPSISITDTEPSMPVHLVAAGTKASLQFMIIGKMGFEDHNVEKNNDSKYRNEFLAALGHFVIIHTTNWAGDPGNFPFGDFSCSYAMNSFIVTTDASFLPVMMQASALRVTIQSGVYITLQAMDREFQAKSKVQHISSMMWAHVSAPNALDSTSVIVQTIQKEFAKAGLDVPDAKAQFGDIGQALDRYHADFVINRVTGIVPDGMMRLKNIKLPSEVFAYTRLSREFIQKYEIKDCCFAMPHFDSTKYPNTHCTCSSAKKTVRVGNKREMQDQARRRIMDKQARGN